MYYDPMIAKLCTWGTDRALAIQTMRSALDSFELAGIGHNIPFLQAVYDHDRFERGDITTAFIAEEYPDGFEGADVNSGHTRKIAAVTALMHDITEHRARRKSLARSPIMNAMCRTFGQFMWGRPTIRPIFTARRVCVPLLSMIRTRTKPP